MNSKFSKCLDSIHMPEELAEKTLKRMETCPAGGYAAPKRRSGRLRLALSIAAAAAAVCLLCTGIYACTSGWLGEFLGDKASEYETADFSPDIENVRISCGDPEIVTELDSVYLIDELMFLRLHITRPGGFELPPDMSPENSSGSFWEIDHKLSQDTLNFSPWSEISGTDGAGGLYMNCTLMSSGGYHIGDKIHYTPRRLVYNYWGEDESFESFNVITNVAFNIYFELASVPESRKLTASVGKPVSDDNGDPFLVESVTVSPLFAVVRTDLDDCSRILDFYRGREIMLILENGEHIKAKLQSASAGLEGGEIIIFWGNEDSLNPIDPDTVSQLVINDLTIDCKG